MQLMHIVQLIVHRIAVAVVLVPLAEAEVVSPEAAEAEADKIKKTWKNEMNLLSCCFNLGGSLQNSRLFYCCASNSAILSAN